MDTEYQTSAGAIVELPPLDSLSYARLFSRSGANAPIRQVAEQATPVVAVFPSYLLPHQMAPFLPGVAEQADQASNRKRKQ